MRLLCAAVGIVTRNSLCSKQDRNRSFLAKGFLFHRRSVAGVKASSKSMAQSSSRINQFAEKTSAVSVNSDLGIVFNDFARCDKFQSTRHKGVYFSPLGHKSDSFTYSVKHDLVRQNSMGHSFHREYFLIADHFP